MAKTTKGGLGRGLGSLMGTGAFESVPAAPSSRRERVTIDGENITSPEKKTEERPSVLFQNTNGNAAAGVTKVEKSVEAGEARDIVSRETILSSRKKEEPVTDEVDLGLIYPNPDQPRTNFKAEEIEELAESIEKDGLLQPILVRPMEDGRYQIIAGERRYQACKKLGLKKVPIRTKDADDDRVLELALIENIQRADLNPIEEAYGYKRLMERKGMTQAEIAQAMSKGRSTVANALRLLELPEEAQQLLFEDKITAGHARAILSIPSKEGRQTLTKKLIEEKMSVREAEALARLLTGRTTESKSPRQAAPASYKKVAKVLKDTLQTNVRVKTVKGKNKIEIEFSDEADLERVFGLIVPAE